MSAFLHSWDRRTGCSPTSDALYEDFENPDASLGAEDIAMAVQAEAAAGSDAFSARLLTRLFGRPDAEFRDDLTFLLIGLNAS